MRTPDRSARRLTEHPPEAAPQAERWLEGIRRGDPDALELLYEHYSGRVYAVLLRILSADSDAQEVLQDVFLKAWTCADNYDPSRGPVCGWLLSIARSRAIDRFRKVATQSELEAQSSAPATPVGVFEQVARLESQDRLQMAMSELPPEQRQVVALAYFDGLSLPEIAATTATPLGTVKTRMRLGLSKLAVALGTP